MSIDSLFREQSTCIKIYVGKESQVDPYEKNVTTVHLNPITIKGIVTDLTATKIMYAMPGIIADKAKEIVTKKKHRSLLEQSQKIQIKGDSDLYEGWRSNGKMQIREEEDYIRVYIYNKKTN
jgi:hypothetical protein